MDKGLWIWPSDLKGQRRILNKFAEAPHLSMALQGIAKSKDGLSNSELDELLGDNSNWMTLWLVRQLLALGFIESKIDLFGEPARYIATELGRNVVLALIGKPPPTATPTPPIASAAQPAAPRP